MLRFLKFRKKDTPLKQMSAKELSEYLAEVFPQSIRQSSYVPPKHRCSRWVLINGPAYCDAGFRGTVIAETSKLCDWMEHHEKNVFSSDQGEQAARMFLPNWFRDADTTDESVTFLDKQQRDVLQGHSLKFVWSDWCKVWCPDCGTFHGRIKEHDQGWVQTGRVTIQYDDLHCLEGHLLQKEQNYEPIRWIY
jgi:hypothetical protein